MILIFSWWSHVISSKVFLHFPPHICWKIRHFPSQTFPSHPSLRRHLRHRFGHVLLLLQLIEVEHRMLRQILENGFERNGQKWNGEILQQLAHETQESWGTPKIWLKTSLPHILIIFTHSKQHVSMPCFSPVSPCLLFHGLHSAVEKWRSLEALGFDDLNHVGSQNRPKSPSIWSHRWPSMAINSWKFMEIIGNSWKLLDAFLFLNATSPCCEQFWVCLFCAAIDQKCLRQ